MPIRLTEETFRGLLESAPDAMVIVERDGTIVLVNSQTERVFGYRRDELLGKPVEILLPDRYRKEHVGYRDRYFESPRLRPMGAGLDLFGLHKDGREIPVEISLSPLHTTDGVFITSAIRDVSERKRIERELKQAREQADAANRAKSEFLANMSHEIRTPLAGILGYAEMLIQYGKSEEERKEFAAKIKRNADNLSDIINDILDLSKVEAGALKVETLSFSPLAEVENALSAIESQAEEKGLVVETSVRRPIPERIESDPTRLRQILINVLGNAVKFTEKGKVTLTVRADGPNRLHFDIEDTGCGIAPEIQSKLFSPFVQADSSTTRKFGGTGLGLVLSRKLAQALGGDLVLAESTPGKGSRFTLTVLSRLAPASAPAVSASPAAGEGNLTGIRVLLAEDNADNEELVREFLGRRGAFVEVAHNGAEALALARSEPYDVVLMDLQMPVVDGYEATRRLRSEGIGLPVVALTAHAMAAERDKCLKAGFTDFLTKPIDVKALVSTVERLGRRS